jgi:NAD(P)-dependent dehydrogenase (short-subunit alcohol dehydrogenase family)
MFDLTGRIALVTGASRGVGRGIALGLGEAGATVYVTGRTAVEGEGREGLTGSVRRTAEEVTALGGQGIPVLCDHTDDTQVEALVDRIRSEQGRIDILVNNVWAGYEHMVEEDTYTWELPFWQQPLWRWDAMFTAGVRAHFTASRLAAPLMVAQNSGLIIVVSFWAAQKYIGNVLYGAAKAADDKLVADMAHELRPHNVAVVSLYPGLVRTEGVMAAAQFFDLSNSESPQYVGRAVAGLAVDPHLMDKTGQVWVTAVLAGEYGFTDIDGKRIIPATLATA